MAKMHETTARDNGLDTTDARAAGKRAADRLAAESARSRGKQDPGASSIPNVANLQGMATHEIVALLVRTGVDFSDCLTHDQLLERARGATGRRGASHHPAYRVHVPASKVSATAYVVDRSRAKD